MIPLVSSSGGVGGGESEGIWKFATLAHDADHAPLQHGLLFFLLLEEGEGSGVTQVARVNSGLQDPNGISAHMKPH